MLSDLTIMTKLEELFAICINGNATADQQQELLNLLAMPENEEAGKRLFQANWENPYQSTDGIPEFRLLQIQQAIISFSSEQYTFEGLKVDQMPATQVETHQLSNTPVADPGLAKIRFLRSRFLRYAAAVVLICGVGIYLWRNNASVKPGAQLKLTAKKEDVKPGGNRAMLTLGDGTVIILDSAASGNLAQQGGSLVKKLADGQVVYISEPTTLNEEIIFNTMSTPNGGQYRLSLPDGSVVWLNAASSITYPTQFSGNDRTVNITGEAYFEVAKNPAKPFRVKTYRDEILVTGTSFNINSYKDEPVVKTSLLEGSVRIGNKILRPGQAYQNGDIVKTNLSQDIAWKNGMFNFEGKRLEEVMRRISKWYDIEIFYPSGIPNIEFGGDLNRGLNLSQILKALESSEVHFQLEGKRLVVKP